MDIKVTDTLINPLQVPSQPVGLIKTTRNGTHLYNVWIYLTGADVSRVNRVRYTLHSSFRNPNFDLWQNALNPSFAFSFWTYGTFTVQIGIQFKDGTVAQLSHQLKWDEELKQGRVTLQRVFF